MTADVTNVLDKICNDHVFKNELYFAGGTALSYYLNHRISEDIDIVASKALPYKKLIPAIKALGAEKLQDENVTALRMAGLFPDEYMIKFLLDEVKIEFFQANRPIQKEILQAASFTNYKDSNLKILDVKSVAKLKIAALLMREKSRDLYDFGCIVKHGVLSDEEILHIFSKIKNEIASIEDINCFINSKKEPLDDEAVYLSQNNRIDLSFDEIKADAIDKIVKRNY